MPRKLLHFVAIGAMILLGIGIFIFSILTSHKTKQDTEIEHSKDKPQKSSQLRERRLPQIERKVDKDHKGTEESLESAFQNDFSKDAFPEEQGKVHHTHPTIPSMNSN